MSTSLINIEQSLSTCFGAEKTGNKYRFTVSACPSKSLTLNLYTLNGAFIQSVDLMPYNVASDVFSTEITVSGNAAGLSYDYTCDNSTFNDSYMTCHTVSRKYKEVSGESNTERAVIKDDFYDFENDRQLKIPYEDIIAYQLHVRGFTKHPSSKVRAKGTYLGITEKIDHFKQLCINQIILMPSYEFYEYDSDVKVLNRLNYWGFKDGYYFCPKAGYSYSKDFTGEFKDMVMALHKAGIEVVMQFYFPGNVSPLLISDCLKFWYINYHVDGFYIMGEKLPLNIIYSNPVLYDAKLYVDNVNRYDDIFKSQKTCRYICDVNKRFLYDTRRFLKGDDDVLEKFSMAQSYRPDDIYNLNFLTCYEGFTLNDLVSYSKKHNEDNGESNKDGLFDNLSWNCGVEGKSNKKQVKELRLALMKNAMCLLMLSKASPMIFMGDELMNTQNGNNNPYCHDNAVTWLNWSLNSYNVQLFDFVKMINKFRADHGIIHKKCSMVTASNSAGSGFPDISYHQENAWQCRMDGHLHNIGIMLCDENDTLYLAYNMHWENHLFGLPKLKKGYSWKYLFDTSGREALEFETSLNDNQENICLYKRSVMVLKAVREDI